MGCSVAIAAGHASNVGANRRSCAPTRCMRGRGRWGNVGRAFGVAALVAVVVAWPRLDGGEVVLPSDGAVPIVAGAPDVDGAGRPGAGAASGAARADDAAARSGGAARRGRAAMPGEAAGAG